MDDLPIIHTARLTLFVAGPGEAERIAEYNRDNVEFLKPWEPPMSPRSVDLVALRELRARALDDARAGTAYLFAFVARGDGTDGPILGWCNFQHVIRGVFQACILGYKLDYRAQGQGYMTEALGGGIGFLFTT